MSDPKTTIDLPFSPEDVRMGRHLGNAIAGYRDGDFKRSAEGMVEAVRAFQEATEEIERLRGCIRRMSEVSNVCIFPYLNEICSGCRCYRMPANRP